MQRIDGFSLYEKQMNKMMGAGRKNDLPKEPGKRIDDPRDTFERTEASRESVMNGVELSEGAKNLLEELKNKYTNMDFFVADYSTEEEAQQYLRRGTKEFSVLIDPETLEQMAANEETKAKYTQILDNAGSTFDELKEGLGEDGKYVDHIGITFEADGTVKYFAHLTQMAEKQREHIDEVREKAADDARAEEKREAEKERVSISEHREDRRMHGPVKVATVSAGSVEELISAVKSVDWDHIEVKEPQARGTRFDLSV